MDSNSEVSISSSHFGPYPLEFKPLVSMMKQYYHDSLSSPTYDTYYTYDTYDTYDTGVYNIRQENSSQSSSGSPHLCSRYLSRPLSSSLTQKLNCLSKSFFFFQLNTHLIMNLFILGHFAVWNRQESLKPPSKNDFIFAESLFIKFWLSYSTGMREGKEEEDHAFHASLETMTSLPVLPISLEHKSAKFTAAHNNYPKCINPFRLQHSPHSSLSSFQTIPWHLYLYLVPLKQQAFLLCI